MSPDMHESLLATHQRHVDWMAALDEAEDAASRAAYKRRYEQVMEAYAVGGKKVAELLCDHDAAIRDDSPTAWDVLTELARHVAAGSVDAGLACVASYLAAVASKDAQEAADEAACNVSRIALDGGAA